MTDNFNAKVLADSISPSGVRLITAQATFPRFILAEVNTHRVLSRNSASSRAIPPEKLIQRVHDNPFIPETFNTRVKGMGVGDDVDESTQEQAEDLWVAASQSAVYFATRLNELNIDKSRVNRLLEPFMWHTAIISATSWDNFFALRAPEGDHWVKDFPAQPEFQKIAILMRQVMRKSTPVEKKPFDFFTSDRFNPADYWHMPLVSESEIGGIHTPDYWPMVSAGRCARVSYDTQDNYEEPEKSYERAVRLKDSGHLSPFEHVARVACFVTDKDANFKDWIQYRASIPHEENFALISNRKPFDSIGS